MLRLRLNFTPHFTGELQGWATNHVKRNLWRAAREHDFNDLMQDAWVYFAKIRDTYPYIIESKHFMAVYKRSFINHLHGLANKKTKRREISMQLNIDGGEFQDVLGEESPDISIVDFNCSLVARPSHCRGVHIMLEKSKRKAIVDRAINFLVKYPTFKKRHKKRSIRNEELCKNLEIFPYIDIIGNVETWILEGVL